MKEFKKVAVLMGGPSSEREVSLNSGRAVAKGLREAGYEVAEVDVTGREIGLPPGVDAAFVALHGEFGEDGGVQALLERSGVPYTGSGPAASRRSFDKKLSKEVFMRCGIPTPEYELLRPGGRRSLRLPVVVKPPCQGSSIGVSRVFTEAEWEPALKVGFHFGPELLVEEYIEGRELTVGIVGTEALPLVEIVAPDGNYDYESKYTRGRTQYLVPAPVEESTGRECQALALRVFTALGCRGFARVDFRLTASGRLFVLELNNIPGFTETSLLPKAAACAGLAFPALCDRILSSAALGEI
jgi:D-alanine-D-alanine ligase